MWRDVIVKGDGDDDDADDDNDDGDDDKGQQKWAAVYSTSKTTVGVDYLFYIYIYKFLKFPRLKVEEVSTRNSHIIRRY